MLLGVASGVLHPAQGCKILVIIFAGTEEECKHTRSLEVNQNPSADLKVKKVSENENKANLIICDDMMVNTIAQETWETSAAIQTKWLHNTSNQSQHDQWSEIEKTQKRLCLKLNLSEDAKNIKNKFEQDTEQKCSESVSTGATIERPSSLSENNTRISETPSSIPKELISESYSPSPSLARSPAMHDGFRDKDWKVERRITPIKTPESVKTLTSRVPQLSDEEEGGETDSVNSESDPISKGSGTSSFLPSSVSDSRTGSLKNKIMLENAGGSDFTCPKSCGSTSESAKDAEDNEEQKPQSKSLHPSVPTDESNIVLPPAGFTDSPVRNLPPACSADINGTVSKVFGTTESEILMLSSPKEEDREVSAQEKTQAEDHPLLGVTQLNKMDLNESYHHPELVVCQRQGIF